MRQPNILTVAEIIKGAACVSTRLSGGLVMANDGAFLTVAATPTAEQSAVARAPIGVSDEAMTGAWRVIIARVPDRYVTYYYHENDDARLRVALKLQAERWVASHEG